MVAEPLEKGLGEDIEKGKAPRWVGLKMGQSKIRTVHRSHPRLHELTRSTSALCRCFGLGLGFRLLFRRWVLSRDEERLEIP